ncbi:MAG: TonB-dependent receptor domain-containing protein, partial [Methylophilaceae bacterium]
MLLQRFKIHFNHRALFSYLYKINILLILALLLLIAGLFFISDSFAAGFSLNTSIPSKTYNIPSGNLGKALATYSAQAGVVLVFDPLLTEGKQSPGLKGEYGLNEGFATLLKGSGLEVAGDGNGEYSLKRAKVVIDDSKNLPVEISLKETVVRSKRFYEMGPLPGLGLTKEQIPGNVQSISAKEIQESHALSMTDLMNKKLQSVNVNDYQGNPFQMDVTYRGFTAGPQIGTPQGLSVFFDGIRVNEPFGDVVNWDMIPMNALASVDVFPGSNPIFGLNTLGGAFTVKTKDGFNHEGVNAEVLTGSYGRKQLQVTGGWNNGTVALFGAGNFFLEDGWRENSPSRVNQLFGKGSYRGEKLDLNISTLLVQTDLVGNGLLPSEMYKQNRDGSFSSEDTTKNKLQQFQLSGSYFVSDTFTITGQVYRRDSERKQKGADVYTEFGDKLKNRNLRPGEEFTCVYNSTGQAAKYGLPDYYVLNLAIPTIDPNGEFSNDFLTDYISNKGSAGTPDYSLPNGYTIDPLTGNPNPQALQPVSASFNQELPAEVVAAFTNNFKFWQNFDVTNYSPSGQVSGDVVTTQTTPDGDVVFKFSGVDFLQTFAGTSNPNSNINPNTNVAYYYDVDAQGNAIQDSNGNYVRHAVVFLKPDNAENCLATQFSSATGSSNRGILTELDPVTNQPITVDGLYQNNGKAGGVVEGTPTAVINDGMINQITDGASVQLNWNIPHHKFMVGASIDSSHAEYANEQKLGILDATRKASLNPDLIRDEYAAATIGVRSNDFGGNNITKSIYASETWSPIETLHITSAMRYNATKANIELASRRLGDQFNDISNFYATPDYYNLAINGVRPATGYKIPDLASVLGPAEKEKHSYYSLNPSLGVSWQAKENLNIFGNLAQGTRTPSVIELGCAFDHTLVQGPKGLMEKSLAENRNCSLPNTLSGDPHLPQIKATTYDIGMRGTFANILGAENIEWNLGAYRTDLKDDIYLITFPGNQNFFDTIGNTRRQGIE